jgi:LPXTG-motif cell wall-anchored protein
LAATLILSASIPLAAPVAASAAPVADPAASAAGWLGRELASGGDVLALNGATDWGLTIDALFALAAAGVGADQGAATAAKLNESGEAYIGAAADIDTKWSAVAKLALALQVAGLDPSAFPVGGSSRDLIADLNSALRPDGSFGSSDSAFSHALALIALSRAGGAPTTALNWLTAQSCSDLASPDFGSFGWDNNCGSPDADATALALQGLLAAGLDSADPTVAAATEWLAGKQEPDGGFPSSWGGANANTTGLAVGTLSLVGGFAGAEQGAKYIDSLRITCATLDTANTPLTEDAIGAIAMDRAGFEEAVEFGLDEVNTDQFRRATSQAIFAFGAPGPGELTLSGAEASLPTGSCAEPSQSTGGSQSSQQSTPAAAGSTSSTAAALPRTGPTISVGLSALALVAVIVGAALVAARRRQQAHIGADPQPGASSQ